jgi:hypothetical protein
MRSKNCCSRRTSRAKAEFRYAGGGSPSSASFPLTPALSPWERENPCQSLDDSDNVRIFQGCALRLPLPEGEGRGEGEQDIRQPAIFGV